MSSASNEALVRLLANKSLRTQTYVRAIREHGLAAEVLDALCEEEDPVLASDIFGELIGALSPSARAQAVKQVPPRVSQPHLERIRYMDLVDVCS